MAKKNVGTPEERHEAARKVFEKAQKDWGELSIGGKLTAEAHAAAYEAWKAAKVVWGEAETLYYSEIPSGDPGEE